ncbi:MAG: MarR family winged helix-turn-helix transcriptional regulator [Bacillota bacterium]|jgi:DNA-binding MarR family transcriptional regulator
MDKSKIHGRQRINRKVLIEQIDSLIYVLARKFSQEIAQIIEGEISASQFLVLRFLAQSGPAKVSQIAEKMQITPSAVTLLANDLTAKNLVIRERDKKDRRVVYIYITEKGSDILKELEILRRRAAENLLYKLSDLELSNIVATLEKLATSITIA